MLTGKNQQSDTCISGRGLRMKRMANGIPGHVLCKAISDISRSRLSLIETHQVEVTAEELSRISGALDQIIESRRRLAKLAAKNGLSLTAAGVRL